MITKRYKWRAEHNGTLLDISDCFLRHSAMPCLKNDYATEDEAVEDYRQFVVANGYSAPAELILIAIYRVDRNIQ